jgi:hypothetical protein
MVVKTPLRRYKKNDIGSFGQILVTKYFLT